MLVWSALHDIWIYCLCGLPYVGYIVFAVFYHGIMTKDTTGKPGIQAKDLERSCSQQSKVRSVASVGAWGYASVKIQPASLQQKTCADIECKLVKEARLSDR
ncbi:hypothetical protein BDR03DRAFT_986968 [Suillus americanus]|nr:hypothetical protein BDR03DRAFT_986968 [Suillus americanus]